MSFVPDILKAGAKEEDKIKQFQYAIKLLLANTNHQLATKQPINPILGETHTCMIGDAHCYLEQTSHHPPISSFYVEGPGYIYSGNYQIKPGIGMPHVYMYLLGDTQVKFTNTGNVFKMNSPYIRVKGIITGSKKLIIEGHGFVWSPNLNYITALKFSAGGGGMKRWIGKPKDRDEVEGTAFSVHPDTIKKFEKSKQLRDDPKLKDGKNLCAKLFKIEAKWTDTGKIGDM